METADALRMAQEKRLDLIEIVPKTRPPVCRLMDSGKFKYEHEKQIRVQRTKQKEVEVKGIRIGFTTGKHDLEMRAEQIKKFFEKGHKAKIDMVLRGREKSHRDLARKIFDDFLALIPGIAFDMEPKKTPQGFIAVIRKTSK